MREPRFKICVNATVVSPNFQTVADPTLVASECLLYGLLVIDSLDFFDAKNMAGMVDKENTERSHIVSTPDARPRTLIWINLATANRHEFASPASFGLGLQGWWRRPSEQLALWALTNESS